MSKRAQMSQRVQKKSRRHFKGQLIANERGLSTIEYIIITCLIAVVGFAVWKRFGENVKAKVDGANTTVGGLPAEA